MGHESPNVFRNTAVQLFLRDDQTEVFNRVIQTPAHRRVNVTGIRVMIKFAMPKSEGRTNDGPQVGVISR